MRQFLCSVIRELKRKHGVCVRQAMIDDGKLELLQEMYASWPFFSVTLDMVEMVRLRPHAAYDV